MWKQYAGVFLVVQTDGGAEKKVTTAGFVLFLPSDKKMVCIGKIETGSTNNEAELVVIC